MEILISDAEKQDSLGRFLDKIQAANPHKPKTIIDVKPGLTGKTRAITIRGNNIDLWPLLSDLAGATTHVQITACKLVGGSGATGILKLEVKILNA